MIRMSPKPFDLPLLKMTVRRLLLALDLLHSEAGVVHTGISCCCLIFQDYSVW
jgi:non-specific serine/threonine protein kinase